jgi:hypothetical protein
VAQATSPVQHKLSKRIDLFMKSHPDKTAMASRHASFKQKTGPTGPVTSLQSHVHD